MTTGSLVSDEAYIERVRAVLLADPCRGVPTEPAQLLPHIYIGSQNNAESLRLLRRLGIDHVLNVAGYKGPRPSAHASPYEGLGIDYYEFQAEDVDSYDITRHFGEAFRYLDKVKQSGGKALVHCAMGVNRSAAVCAGYIMHHRRLTLLKTIQLIKDQRRVCLTNKGFQRQLVRYARCRGLLDDIVVESDSRFSGKSVDERIESSLRREHKYDDGQDKIWERGAEIRLSSSFPSKSYTSRDPGTSQGGDVLSRRIRDVLDSTDHRQFELPSHISRSIRSSTAYDPTLMDPEPRRMTRDRYISRDDRF